MSNESYYRLAAAVLVSAAMVVGGYHRLRALRAGGPVSRKDEPLPILIPLRVAGLLAMLVAVAYLVAPRWVTPWAAVGLPPWLRWTGAALLGAAVALLFVTLRTLGNNLTDTVATRRAHTLVTSGPYRFVRHPFYCTVLLVIAGLSLLTALWPVAVLGAVALALLFVRTPIEEAKLAERFGDEWRAYAARTGRFFPRGRRG